MDRLHLTIRQVEAGALTIEELITFLQYSPPNSLYHRAVRPDESDWDLTNHLLAHIADLLQIANWARGGGKGRKPSLIPRPGVGPKKRRLGGTKVSLAEAAGRLFGRRRGGGRGGDGGSRGS